MCSIGRKLRSRRGPPPQNEEEFVFAAADAMREEYKAIVDAGIVLQIDDPSLPDNWDMVDPEPPLQEFKRVRIEALNHALRGLRRMHPLHLLGKLARPAHHRHSVAGHRRPGAERQCRRLLGGGGNVRHEHEWRVWQDVALPDGKLLIPGVVSRSQHRGASPGGRRPDRAIRAVVGRERDRRHGLRVRRPDPSADRLGEAAGAGRRCKAREQGALK